MLHSAYYVTVDNKGVTVVLKYLLAAFEFYYLIQITKQYVRNKIVLERNRRFILEETHTDVETSSVGSSVFEVINDSRSSIHFS